MTNIKNINVFVPARNTGSARAIFNTASGKKAVEAFESMGSARVNALAITVDTLKLAKGSDKMFVIYTVGLVSDAIQRGTFKYWLKTGATSNGEKLDEVELSLWQDFAALYQETFMNVVFKNISRATINKNAKYAITDEAKLVDKMAREAWDLVPETTELQSVDMKDVL